MNTKPSSRFKILAVTQIYLDILEGKLLALREILACSKENFQYAQGIISICSIGICTQARHEPASLIPKIDTINIAPGR